MEKKKSNRIIDYEMCTNLGKMKTIKKKLGILQIENLKRLITSNFSQ